MDGVITITNQKRRGRKPLNQKKELDKNIIQTHLTEMDSHKESLIAHIPIDNDDIFDCHTFIDNNKVDENVLLRQEIKQLKKQLSDIKKQKEQEYKDIKKQSESVVIETSLPIFKLNECKEHKNTKCWWCTYTFTTNPIYLPHKYINKYFSVTGYFCSFNCVLSYNYSLRDANITQRANMIYLMYNQLLGIGSHISPAPPKEVLEDYGGFMTISEFREKSQVYSKSVRVILPPMRSLYVVVEECDSANTQSNKNSYVPLNKADIINAKSKLNLKRNVPKKSNYISIEESLGLIKI